jgi:CheY-like chemotaxis protein
MEDQIIAESVDFIIVDPATYVLFENIHGVNSMATMETLVYLPLEYTQRSTLNNVSSVIFTKADRTDIEYLDDIVGTSFMAPDSSSFEGYDAISASNGKEGINRALNFLPDEIILDLMMPKVDVFAVINELKNHPETIDIPIIVCTAKDLENYEKEQLDEMYFL